MDFRSSFITKVITYGQLSKPNAAYLEVKGWFTREELVKLIEFVDEGLKAKKT